MRVVTGRLRSNGKLESFKVRNETYRHIMESTEITGFEATVRLEVPKEILERYSSILTSRS